MDTTSTTYVTRAGETKGTLTLTVHHHPVTTLKYKANGSPYQHTDTQRHRQVTFQTSCGDLGHIANLQDMCYVFNQHRVHPGYDLPVFTDGPRPRQTVGVFSYDEFDMLMWMGFEFSIEPREPNYNPPVLPVPADEPDDLPF